MSKNLIYVVAIVARTLTIRLYASSSRSSTPSILGFLNTL